MTTTATVPPSAPAPKPRCPQLAALIPVSAPHSITPENKFGWAWSRDEDENAAAVFGHVNDAVAAGCGSVVLHAPHGCSEKPTLILDGHLHTTRMREPFKDWACNTDAIAMIKAACKRAATDGAAVIVWAGPPRGFGVASVGMWITAFPLEHHALKAVIVDSAGWPLSDSPAFRDWFQRLGSIVDDKLGYEGPIHKTTKWVPGGWQSTWGKPAPPSGCSIGHWFACSKQPDPWDVSRPPSLMLLTGTDADRAAYHRLGLLDDGPRAVERAMVRARAWCATLWPNTTCAIPIHRLSVGELAQLQGQCTEVMA